jgi:tripeptide aminopeptidase
MLFWVKYGINRDNVEKRGSVQMNTQERIISRFLDYVKIDSETGDEAAIAQRLAVDLERLGCCVTTDCIQETAKTSGSNVYAVRQGDPKLAPILFSAHMDTVAPGKGIQPVAGADGYLYSNGTTVLGGDDKAGICAIMEALERTARDHCRTVEVVFTVREESGMLGSKHLDYSRLQSKKCVVLDSDGGPEKVIVGAPGQNKIYAEIFGKKAHAGLEPEKGVSAIQAAAHGVAAMELLRIDEETTCNIGTFLADGPTNIVAEKARLVLEVRSRSAEKLERQTSQMVHCLERACESFGAVLSCQVETSYPGYQHDPDSELVRQVFAAVRKNGLDPDPAVSGGGSDANVFNQHGIAAVAIGVGMERVHTNQERLCIRDMLRAAEVCADLIRGE